MLRLVVMWSEASELVSQGPELPMMAVLDEVANAISFVGGFFP